MALEASTTSGVLRRTLSIGAVCAALAPLAACGGPTYRYRYRLTVWIEVNGRLVSGSGVREIRVADVNALPNPGSLVTTRTHGDAIPIDLGDGRVLFMLNYGYQTPQQSAKDFTTIEEWSPTALFSQAIGNPNLWSGGQNALLQRLSSLGSTQPIDVAAGALPAMAFLLDRRRPDTARLVDPVDIAEAVGTSVELHKASIELTTEPVTRGIEQWLPWLSDLKQQPESATVSGTMGVFNPRNIPQWTE